MSEKRLLRRSAIFFFILLKIKPPNEFFNERLLSDYAFCLKKVDNTDYCETFVTY